MLEESVSNENIQEETSKLLQSLIKNKCVNTGDVKSGNEMKSVDTLIKYFESYGIHTYEVFEPAPARGSLLVTIAGSSENKSLTL